MGIDPISMLVAGSIIGIGGTAYQAYSGYQQGKKEKRLLNEQAAQEREAAAAEAADVREKGRRLLASQRAALAASGVNVDEGTGDALQTETQRLTEQDALAVLKGGANRSSLLQARGKIAGQRADASLISGALNVGAQAVTAGDKYSRAKKAVTQNSLDESSQSFARRNRPRYSLLGGTGFSKL